jgi:hypothetical protein
MKEIIAVIGTVAFVVAVWTVSAKAQSASNEAMKMCLEINGYTLEKFDTFDFSKAAACHSEYRVRQNQIKLANLRQFLKDNPRYRYPGQSDNRCFGKPREMAFEHINGSAGAWGWNVNIKYKDVIKPCIIGPFEEDPYAAN